MRAKKMATLLFVSLDNVRARYFYMLHGLLEEMVDKFLYPLLFKYLYRGDFHQPRSEVFGPLVQAILNTARKR